MGSPFRVRQPHDRRSRLTLTLPAPYETAFERLLADVAFATPADVPLVPFWPLRGAAYDGELLVIGRSVNGWVEDWTAAQLRDPDQRTAAVTLLRRDAEPADRDRMAWATDLWGATDGYNTRRSAFWRVLSRLVPGGPGDGWPGRLVWTNLYKVSPAAGWNPGADLQRAQRPAATELLRRELTEYAPRRVLALTGSWIDPFAGGLGLTIATRGGLVEGLGERDGTRHAIVMREDPQAREAGDGRLSTGRTAPPPYSRGRGRGAPSRRAASSERGRRREPRGR